MPAAVEESALLGMLPNDDLTEYELHEDYTPLLDGLEIKTPKRSEFLALVQNFLARSKIETTKDEIDEAPFIHMFVHRFISVWGGAVWGSSEFSDVEPAMIWTYECQRVTERM
jgi:hypothetical protein